VRLALAARLPASRAIEATTVATDLPARRSPVAPRRSPRKTVPDRSRPRQPANGPGLLATASAALAAFLVLVVILATQLRGDPGPSGLQKPGVVVVRRVYETVIHERIIAAPGAGVTTGVGRATVSSSGASPAGPSSGPSLSPSVPSYVPPPVPRTRTS